MCFKVGPYFKDLAIGIISPFFTKRATKILHKGHKEGLWKAGIKSLYLQGAGTCFLFFKILAIGITLNLR